ncbi:MAG: hypothetical protein VX757_09595, partial [Planctomycetota bacterium]|nr:hypothetical protein [Planctomycetota bacterium]
KLLINRPAVSEFAVDRYGTRHEMDSAAVFQFGLNGRAGPGIERPNFDAVVMRSGGAESRQ